MSLGWTATCFDTKININIIIFINFWIGACIDTFDEIFVMVNISVNSWCLCSTFTDNTLINYKIFCKSEYVRYLMKGIAYRKVGISSRP